MGRFVAGRVIQAIPTFFGITLLSFTILRLAPGDPVLILFGASNLSAQEIASLRSAYGLDQPIPIQYLRWLGHVLTGDFGQSFLYKRPVAEMIQTSLPNTLVLAGLAGIANYSRYMRAETLEVLSQDYVRTARAKGLQENLVLFVHALRNALLPLVTALGTQIAFLVSGAVVIEQVFAWPGMGRMTFEAARSKDYPIVMAVVVIASAVLLLSYIARDIAYG